MIYIIDTSSLSVLKNYYPQRFPSFWAKLDCLVETGRLRSVREVKREIARLDSEHVGEWLKQQGDFYHAPTVKEYGILREIFEIKHFEQLVGEKQRLRGTPVADPFLIAAAKACDGFVVTEERFKENAARIPNVCQHLKVNWMPLEQMIAQEGWIF